MNKMQIIQELKSEYPITSKEAAFITQIFFDSLSNAIKSGDRIEIRGFGTLSIRKREKSAARNPKTGDKVNVKERHVVYFRAGKELLDLVNARKKVA